MKATSSGFVNRTLSIVLIVVIIAAIGGYVYLAKTAEPPQKFTEFYILGPTGKADNYPRIVQQGEAVKVIAGIVNREYREVSYRIAITIDGQSNREIGPIRLASEEHWEQPVSFTPTRVGDNQKVELLLFKDAAAEPYLKLQLWIDVRK